MAETPETAAAGGRSAHPLVHHGVQPGRLQSGVVRAVPEEANSIPAYRGRRIAAISRRALLGKWRAAIALPANMASGGGTRPASRRGTAYARRPAPVWIPSDRLRIYAPGYRKYRAAAGT